MTTNKKYYEKLSRQQKKTFKNHLKFEKKGLCLGKLCKGQIIDLKFFYTNNKCKKCHKESIIIKTQKQLRDNCYKNKTLRKCNRRIMNEWKLLNLKVK